MGAAIVVDSRNVPNVYSRLQFNPLCFLLYENPSQSPEQWKNVNVSVVCLHTSSITKKIPLYYHVSGSWNYWFQNTSWMQERNSLSLACSQTLPSFLSLLMEVMESLAGPGNEAKCHFVIGWFIHQSGLEDNILLLTKYTYFLLYLRYPSHSLKTRLLLHQHYL